MQNKTWNDKLQNLSKKEICERVGDVTQLAQLQLSQLLDGQTKGIRKHLSIQV